MTWFDKVNVFISFEGAVYFKVRADFSVTCSLDMTYFPFDAQTCNIDAATQEFSEYQVSMHSGKHIPLLAYEANL